VNVGADIIVDKCALNGDLFLVIDQRVKEFFDVFLLGRRVPR
jgi:hypothetical protein